VARGPSVDVVREVVRLGVHGRETSLEAWMRENFAALEIELTPKRLNWTAIANRLHDAGLTNAAGGRLTAHTARKTWQRVRASMSRKLAAVRQTDATKPTAVSDDIRAKLSTGRKLPDPI
jgi:hypothetical protein